MPFTSLGNFQKLPTRMNIFHIPNNHGGFSSSLATGERALGFETTVISGANPYSAAPDIELPSVGEAGAVKARLKTFFNVRRAADIIHFNSGSSLFNPPFRNKFLLDLPFYRSKTHKIMTFQGSDIRVEYADVMEESRQCEMELGYKLNDNTAGGIIPQDEILRKKALSRKTAKYADKIFTLNPDLLKSLPASAEFLPYPYFVGEPHTPSIQDVSRPLRIAHLATNRVLKGTGLIEAQLSNLAKWHDIEYRVIVRQPREIAIDAIQWADILIDQVCLGWYGAQAVEALALGKPVLCFLNPQDRQKFLPKGNTGIINCQHHEIAETLAEFCEDRMRVEHYGTAGMAFVKNFHDSKKVAHQVYRKWSDT